MVDFTFLTLIVILILLVTQRDRKTREVGVWFCMLVFILMSGLRAESIGNDTKEYIRVFQNIGSGYYDASESRYELGFLWLNYLLNYISSQSQILFFCCGGFIYYSIGRFILRYSHFPELSVLLFLTYGFFSVSMTVIRQAMAMAILLYAYSYILKGKPIKFFSLVVVAVFFHTTAILFSFAYLARYLKPSRTTILFILLLSVLGYIVFNYLLGEMLAIFTLYENYEGGKYFGETRLASILYVIISAIVLFFSYSILKIKKISWDKKEYTNLRCEFILVLFALGLYILSLKLNILDRIAIYYNIFSILLLPNSVKSLTPKIRVLTITIIVLLFWAYSSTILLLRPDWNSIFPYSIY